MEISVGKWLALCLVAASLLPAPSVAALDVTSGASQGRTMVSVSAITTTSNSANLTFSEGFRNGSLRFYYSTTAFAAAADTTRATVTKVTVGTRGSGTLNVAGLTANTKYYFRFQGWFGRGEGNYWATGSFTTAVSPGVVRPDATSLTARRPAGKDALGRPVRAVPGVQLRPFESELSIGH